MMSQNFVKRYNVIDFFFRNKKFEIFSKIKIAFMKLKTTLFFQYFVLCINFVVCLIFYVEFQSICSNIHQNFICVISKTSWIIDFCFFENIVDMKIVVKIFDQFVKIDKKNETTLILSQMFEHLHINLTFFEFLIVHSDFFCKTQFINEISLFLIEKRNVNDELQFFTFELIELIDEIFYEIKNIFDDLFIFTWQWKFYHWFEIYIFLLIKFYDKFVANSNDLMKKHRHIWFQYFDIFFKKLINFDAKNKKIDIFFLKLQNDFKKIHWLTFKKIKLIQQRLRSKNAKYKIFRFFIDIVDYESQLIFLKNFDYIRETIYVVLINVHKNFNEIDQNIRHTKNQLINFYVKTKLNLDRQIERINNVVMNFDNAKQFIKKKKKFDRSKNIRCRCCFTNFEKSLSNENSRIKNSIVKLWKTMKKYDLNFFHMNANSLKKINSKFDDKNARKFILFIAHSKVTNI